MCPKEQREGEVAPHLGPREWDVLVLLCRADCLLEKMMPAELGISLSTFKTHKEKLYAKFGVDTRHKLIVKAVESGLVPCYCQQVRKKMEG